MEYDVIALNAPVSVISKCSVLAQSIGVYPAPFKHWPSVDDQDAIEKVISEWLFSVGAAEGQECTIKNYGG